MRVKKLLKLKKKMVIKSKFVKKSAFEKSPMSGVAAGCCTTDCDGDCS